MSTPKRDTPPAAPEKPVVIDSQSARAGVISGRVLLVLVASLALAFIAMLFFLGYAWSA